MRQFLLFFIFLLSPSILFAQIDWAHHIGSEYTDYVDNHTTDHEGNIIIVGHFGGKVTFGEQQFTSVGDSDIYIYKASPAGKIIWAKTFSSPNNTGDAGVAVDKAGNIYVAGGYIEELYFENRTILDGNDSWNSFVCKLDTDGKLTWVKGISGINSVSEARGFGVLDTNEAGEVAVSVNISGTVALENFTVTTNGNGGNNLIIAKFSTEGDLEWYNAPVSETNTELRSIKLSNTGQVYITGFYSTNLTLGKDFLNVSTYGHGEIFLAKLDNKGLPVWAKSFNKTEFVNLNNTGAGIDVDEQTQEVYITGNFKGKIQLDNIHLTAANTTEENGPGDMFLAKLTAEGTVIWVKKISTPESDFAQSLVLNQDGLLILSGTLNVRPFMHVYNKDGLQVGGHTLNAYGWVSSTTYIDKGTYYLSGIFAGLFQESSVNWESNGLTYDGFLLRVGTCQNEAALPDKPLLSNTCTSITFENYAGFGTIEWYRNDTKINFETGTELATPTTGYYQVSVRNNCGISYSEKVYFNKEAYLPVVPEIKQLNCKTLEIVNGANQTIEWYRHGQLLQGQTGPTLTFTQTGPYSVRFRNECGYTESIITVDAPNTPQNYTFYNIITPNGDNKNEYFQVDPALLSSSLEVYNRWGNKVYQNKQYQNNWNGEGLASGVYYWAIQNECLGMIRGTITIMR
ncbi:gliding motility-associated C-terminal domain-containing protein [Pontibacter sp. H259]|uniref:T9SS type B sorting domain-containing protein n=1 Tax=Pontibacter sp. H259 TaxID=3133421 RepID=UPI0030BD1890